MVQEVIDRVRSDGSSSLKPGELAVGVAQCFGLQMLELGSELRHLRYL